MTLRLCVLLWAHTGRAEALGTFEDVVLSLLPDHGGRLVSRNRVTDRREGDPLEVQLIEMPDEASLSSYLEDPRRTELAQLRDRDAIIARTQLLRVEHTGGTGR